MKLLQPIELGGLKIRNRIVMPAMHMGYCTYGYINERLIDFYRERAQGGVGLIIVGGCSIDRHRSYPSMMDLSDEVYLPGHRQLVTAIKEAGALVGAQLYHAGRYTTSLFTGIQPIAPSPIASNLTREIPRKMTLEDIEQVVNAFAAAALRAKKAGYDLVEVNACGGYLISQFFSPLTNKRTDNFGGNFDNRTRFGVEVIKAVRRAVGEDYTIMVRLAGHDFMPGGNTNLETRQFARRLQDAGTDVFNVTGGWHETQIPQITMNVPPGAYVYLAQGIKSAVNVPVVACNRINDPWLAEEVLVQGRADLIGMARGLMADPELPRKVSEGRFTEIRKCIGCNQGCLDAAFKNESIACLVNARVGREGKSELRQAVSSKKVLVIGGGPAGMEAARVAALRGHRVTLWERNHKLGGQLLLAGAVPGRSDFNHLIKYLVNSMGLLGIDVVVGKTADIEAVRALNPDVIVVATGAKPILPKIPGAEMTYVVPFAEVLSGRHELGRRVVIIGGGPVGCELGLYIGQMGTIDSETVKFLLLNQAEDVETIKEVATQGTKEVVILEQDKVIGRGIGISTRWQVLRELSRLGVEIKNSVKVISIERDGVIAARDNEQAEKIPADTVVIAIGSRPENSLYEELKPLYPEVYLAGDANQPGTALEAVREGFNIGFNLGN